MTKTRDKLQVLQNELNFPELYKSYSWRKDTWNSGFPDIRCLEIEIKEATMGNKINLENLVHIAKWGRNRNLGKISCSDPLKLSLYDKGLIVKNYYDNPDITIKEIQRQVSGFGPTFASKLLRFASPESFGAIDSRIVMVFGDGGLFNPEFQFLNLKVNKNISGNSISVNKKTWPSEYGTWIAALRYLSSKLNEEGIKCPHPKVFVKTGLRSPDNDWLPADVEMALFSYASERIRGY